MAKVALALLVLSVILKEATCQTFQYSRGWTNGKRSFFNQGPSWPELTLADHPSEEIDGNSESETLSSIRSKIDCRTQKVSLVLRENGKNQLFFVPCNLLLSYLRKTNREKSEDIQPAANHHRRSSSIDYDSNNDNY